MAILESMAMEESHRASISHINAEVQASAAKAEGYRLAAQRIEDAYRDARQTVPSDGEQP